MIRCLIVDDSPTFRGVLREILSKEPQIQVVGEARDGKEAVEKTLSLRPDVVTLDVHMPGQNGLEAIAEIMSRCPTPIAVITAAADDPGEQVSFQALALGAVEVLAKPRADDPVKYARQTEAIRNAVRVVAGIKLVTRREAQTARATPFPGGDRAISCIGIVASTGGPPALHRLLSALPRDFPIPILVVQHIAEGFLESMVQWLSAQTAVKVAVARGGEPLEPGKVLFAPDGRHLVASMGRTRADEGPPVRNFRPSGTVLLASLAREYRTAAAGIVLTGMGDDGVAGLKMIRDQGGLTIAQGKASSVVWGMPRAAVETRAADHTLELDELCASLVQLGPAKRRPARRARLLLVDDAETVLLLEQHLLSGDYELFLARNGEEGVTSAHRLKPDGILMDYSMPVMNGADALRKIRGMPELAKVPVIMVTSETDPAVLQRCYGAGCQAIVPKPIDKRLLVETVHRHVRP